MRQVYKHEDQNQNSASLVGKAWAWKVVLQICSWHCFQWIMWQIVWSICFPFGELNIQRWHTKLCSALGLWKPWKTSYSPIYTHLKPVSFLPANNCLACWFSVLLLSCFISSLYFFPPLCSLSTPPLNRTIVWAGYRAWSIPCYHREINYLDQAAGERGNNERMLLLPRR